MKSGSVDLLDINVWLALSLPAHPFHQRARIFWFEEAAEEIAFCRITSLGFVRLLTQPAVTGEPSLSVAEAWGAYRDFRVLPEVVFLPEPADCEEFLEAWALGGEASRKLWTDAYLAAFARASRLRLVSFDRDFTRLGTMDLLHLEA